MKSYFATVMYVILDSGFCVLKGLIQLRKMGVFACAVTKKRRYQTYLVPGKDTEDNFGDVGVGGGHMPYREQLMMLSTMYGG